MSAGVSSLACSRAQTFARLRALLCTTQLCKIAPSSLRAMAPLVPPDFHKGRCFGHADVTGMWVLLGLCFAGCPFGSGGTVSRCSPLLFMTALLTSLDDLSLPVFFWCLSTYSTHPQSLHQLPGPTLNRRHRLRWDDDHGPTRKGSSGTLHGNPPPRGAGTDSLPAHRLSREVPRMAVPLTLTGLPSTTRHPNGCDDLSRGELTVVAVIVAAETCFRTIQ